MKQNMELDGIDREILRVLFVRKSIVGSQIAKIVGLTSSGIKQRLDYLLENGIIKQARVSKTRSFDRTFNGKVKKIKSPRSIYWELDIEGDSQ